MKGLSYLLDIILLYLLRFASSLFVATLVLKLSETFIKEDFVLGAIFGIVMWEMLEYTRKKITPEKGDLLLFDASTYHRVLDSKKERISLAFNFR